MAAIVQHMWNIIIIYMQQTILTSMPDASYTSGSVHFEGAKTISEPKNVDE